MLLLIFFSYGCLIKGKVMKQVFLKGFLSKGLYHLDVSQLKMPLAITNAQDHVVDIVVQYPLNVVKAPVVDIAVRSLVSSSDFSCNKVDSVSYNKVDFGVSLCPCFLVSGNRTSFASESDKITMIWHNRLGHPSA